MRVAAFIRQECRTLAVDSAAHGCDRTGGRRLREAEPPGEAEPEQSARRFLLVAAQGPAGKEAFAASAWLLPFPVQSRTWPDTMLAAGNRSFNRIVHRSAPLSLPGGAECVASRPTVATPGKPGRVASRFAWQRRSFIAKLLFLCSMVVAKSAFSNGFPSRAAWLVALLTGRIVPLCTAPVSQNTRRAKGEWLHLPGAVSGAALDRTVVTGCRFGKGVGKRLVWRVPWSTERFAWSCPPIVARCRCFQRKMAGIMWLWPLLAGGCASPCTTVVADVNPTPWQAAVAVSVANADTLSPRELYLVLRSNSAFADDTLTLRIGVCAPDSLCYDEPFLVHIPRARKASPLARESRIPYRSHVVLADTGIYRFTFTPVRSVRGIEAVGLCILPDQR